MSSCIPPKICPALESDKSRPIDESSKIACTIASNLSVFPPAKSKIS